MATQILQRGAAHRQLLAKGSHVARKEGHRAGLAPRYQPSDPRASEEPTAAAHPAPPSSPGRGALGMSPARAPATQGCVYMSALWDEVQKMEFWVCASLPGPPP